MLVEGALYVMYNTGDRADQVEGLSDESSLDAIGVSGWVDTGSAMDADTGTRGFEVSAT